MSYDIYLIDENNEVIKLNKPKVMSMGTMQEGGEKEAHVNITYNYGKAFWEHIDETEGIRWLYGKKAKDTIEVLVKAISELKDNFSVDYWEYTEGNAKIALMYLLELALLYPEGIWDGD